MDDKTLEALTALAAKLGTTAEYLWGVLLKQAPITGVVNLLVTVACVIGAVLWFRFVLRKTAKPQPTLVDKYPKADWYAESAFWAWFSVFVVVLLTVLMSFGLATTVAALVNPEYWALKQILR